MRSVTQFLFGPSASDKALDLLESEISFLRSHLQSLQKQIEELNRQIGLSLNPLQTMAAPTNHEAMRPKIFDAGTKSYRPKTDAEMEQDLQGLREMGIL